jgi:hypothetical protein
MTPIIKMNKHMKPLNYILLFSLFLIACGGETPQESAPETEPDQAVEEAIETGTTMEKDGIKLTAVYDSPEFKDAVLSQELQLQKTVLLFPLA